MIPTNGRTYAAYPAETGTQATKWPPHAQWARPAGHQLLSFAAYSSRNVFAGSIAAIRRVGTVVATSVTDASTRTTVTMVGRS